MRGAETGRLTLRGCPTCRRGPRRTRGLRQLEVVAQLHQVFVDVKAPSFEFPVGGDGGREVGEALQVVFVQALFQPVEEVREGVPGAGGPSLKLGDEGGEGLLLALMHFRELDLGLGLSVKYFKLKLELFNKIGPAASTDSATIRELFDVGVGPKSGVLLEIGQGGSDKLGFI